MKNLAILALALAALVGARADEGDYLIYWQIEENEITGSKYASVGITADEGKTRTYLSDAKSGLDTETLSSVGGTSEAFSSVIGTSLPASSYSFFVELFGDSGSLWTSSYLAYSALADYISTPASGTSPAVAATGVWKVSAEQTIPEPTSGLLLAMGAAVLALRRRRRA